MGDGGLVEAGESLFRAVFDASPRPMWLYDHERLTLLAVNDAASVLYGWTREEFLSMDVRDLFAGVDAKALTAAEEARFELRHAAKSGALLHLEIRTTPLAWEGRRIGCAVVSPIVEYVAHDDAERATSEAQRRLEQVLSTTSAVMYTARAHGDFGATYVSPNVTAITGYEARAFVETASFWIDHIHPEDRPAVEQALGRMFEVKEHSFVYRFRHADGCYRWMQDAPRVIRDGEGRPKEIVGYWIDVHDRVQGEHRLRASEASFRTVIEKAPSAIFIHRRGTLAYANAAAVKMLGYDDAAELLGCDVIGLLHPDDRERITVRMDRTIREGFSPLMESGMLRRDGSTLRVEAESVLLDFEGEPSSVILMRDVTERREMFARVAAADRMRSVGTLAAGVAHEINNPLAYVTMNLDLLAAEVPHLRPVVGRRFAIGEIEALVRDAQEGAARVSEIVRELLSLSRANDDATGPVDLRAVVDSCLKIAHTEIRHRAIVVTKIDAALPHALANPSRLAQVILNLLVNAAQAIVEGDVAANEIRVRASASADGTQVWLEIEDTGVGMTPSLMERIFDPFFTTKPVGVGTGLGLAISHHIIRAMGGEIGVTSTPQVGTCFRVTLPVSGVSGGLAAPST
jgi:PAS domain S-box-containing protein